MRMVHFTADLTGRLATKGMAFAAVDLLGKLVALAVVFVLARKQPPSVFGWTVTGIAGSAIIQVIVDGGQGMLQARAATVANPGRAQIIVSSRYDAIVAISLISLAAMTIPLTAVHVASAAVIVGSSSASLSVSALLARHRLVPAAVALVGPNVSFLVLLLLLPPPTATTALLVFAASNFFMAYVSSNRQVDLTPKVVSFKEVLTSYKAGVPIALSSLATTVYGKLDTVLVALLVAPAIAGIYSTFYRIVLAVAGLSSWIAPLSVRYLGDSAGSQQYLAKL